MEKNDSGRSSWENTIAAISTAQGVGGIGVIRVSGRDALAIGDRVFQSAGGKKLSQMKGYTAAYGGIRSNGEDIDEAVALVFRAPAGCCGLCWTGEPLPLGRENLPGGPFLTGKWV